MTIKEFASICGCNVQTIRYYDKINLLKPVRVDEWNGYRYYDEKQALDFVKIKNLQGADFSIEEIKTLLEKSNDEICRAIEKKIEDELAKLEQIKKIHSTYLSQISTMETKISESLRKKASQFNVQDEFEITNEYAEHVLKCAEDYLSAAARAWEEVKEVTFDDYETDDSFDEEDEEEWDVDEDYLNPLESPNYEVIFEKHNWDKTSEVLNELPELESGEYLLHFESNEAKIINTAYTSIILGIVVDKNSGRQLTLACNAGDAKDNKNHFWLLKKK